MDYDSESGQVIEWYCNDCDTTYKPDQVGNKTCDNCGFDAAGLRLVTTERQFASPFGATLVKLWLCGECASQYEAQSE